MKKKDSTNKLGSQLNSNEGVENITASEISGGNNKTFNQKREFLYKRAFYEDNGVTPKKFVSLVDYNAYMNTFPNVINIDDVSV